MHKKNTSTRRGNGTVNGHTSPPPTPPDSTSSDLSLRSPTRGANVSTTEYAARCKELLELQRALNELGYVLQKVPCIR